MEWEKHTDHSLFSFLVWIQTGLAIVVSAVSYVDDQAAAARLS